MCVKICLANFATEFPDFRISGSELSGIVSKTSGFPNVNYPVQCQKLPDFGFEPSGIV